MSLFMYLANFEYSVKLNFYLNLGKISLCNLKARPIISSIFLVLCPLAGPDLQFNQFNLI